MPARVTCQSEVSGQPDVNGGGNAPRRRAHMLEYINALRQREEGQALVEYALILSLISVVAITALTLVGTNVTAILNSIAAAL